ARQRNDAMFVARVMAVRLDEAAEEALGAADVEAHDDMGDLDDGLHGAIGFASARTGTSGWTTSVPSSQPCLPGAGATPDGWDRDKSRLRAEVAARRATPRPTRATARAATRPGESRSPSWGARSVRGVRDGRAPGAAATCHGH